MSGKRAADAPPVARVAMKGLCPRCGSATLFEGRAQVASRCGACGLDFSALQGSERFAGLLILVLAAAIAGLAIAIDTALSPPLLLQVLVWVPLTVAAVIAALRLLKAAAVSAGYRRLTQEGPR